MITRTRVARLLALCLLASGYAAFSQEAHLEIISRRE